MPYDDAVLSFVEALLHVRRQAITWTKVASSIGHFESRKARENVIC